MDVSKYAKIFNVNFIMENKKTILTIENDVYEFPFIIPTQQDKGRILFDKVFTYVLTQTVEDGKVIKDEGSFNIYCIELYEDKFNTAMEEFKKLIFLSNMPLMKDIIIKCFFNIIDISNKSYNKVYFYLNMDNCYVSIETFRQYCGLEEGE